MPPPGACLSVLTADTSSNEPRQEQFLRFKDPYHPSNYQNGAAMPLPVIPEPMALPQLFHQQRYAQQGNRCQPASSSSTAASATNNFDPTKSDATFAPLGQMVSDQEAVGGVVSGMAVRDQQQQLFKGPQPMAMAPEPAAPSLPPPPMPQPVAASEEAVIAFPSSWTRGKLIGAGAFGQVCDHPCVSFFVQEILARACGQPDPGAHGRPANRCIWG